MTVYGIGKTFYWPTMLGVISERFPKGGALALGLSGGLGMISAGLLKAGESCSTVVMETSAARPRTNALGRIRLMVPLYARRS